jgi:hypothetical protein
MEALLGDMEAHPGVAEANNFIQPRRFIAESLRVCRLVVSD